MKALITFLEVGHTKTLADQMFADISKVCVKEDIFNHLYVYETKMVLLLTFLVA